MDIYMRSESHTKIVREAHFELHFSTLCDEYTIHRQYTWLPKRIHSFPLHIISGRSF